jgi:hypothetical protein
MAPLAVVMVAGAAVSAMGAIAQGNAAKSAHQYNAKLREQDAQVALQQSSVDAWRVSQKGEQARGSYIANTGASGGSVEDAMDALRMGISNAKLDEETVKYHGQLAATGLRNNAALERQSGEVAQQQSYLNAASSFLTGAGNAGSTYVSAKKGVPLYRQQE